MSTRSIYCQILRCGLCSADTGGESVESVESGVVEVEETVVDDDRVVAVVVTDNVDRAGGGM